MPELGYRAGIFQKHGIKPELIYTQGAGETLQAIIPGSSEIGVGAGTWVCCAPMEEVHRFAS